MKIEVFLERPPGEDVSVMRCSICKKEFHTSPVGPREYIEQFPAHASEEHPNAVLRREDAKSIASRIVKA
jgi:hypothetical protein